MIPILPAYAFAATLLEGRELSTDDLVKLLVFAAFGLERRREEDAPADARCKCGAATIEYKMVRNPQVLGAVLPSLIQRDFNALMACFTG